MDAAPGDVLDQLEMVRRDRYVEFLGFGTFLSTISVPATGLVPRAGGGGGEPRLTRQSPPALGAESIGSNRINGIESSG